MRGVEAAAAIAHMLLPAGWLIAAGRDRSAARVRGGAGGGSTAWLVCWLQCCVSFFFFSLVFCWADLQSSSEDGKGRADEGGLSQRRGEQSGTER